MSMIDKLSILGVRSFDNVRSETIVFSSPLTLIVGTNGSGKTTIIECLKYATAGELPPNSAKGANWVHDPNLCHEKEVLGQVKLAFRSVTGQKNTVTRSLQLTVKKASRSVKALDGTMTTTKNGERSTFSSRVVELNTMMPQYLGVSKAVLDSVIFCHQEESLWPMATPKDLKEKFDAIFEAEKYSKAIENIRGLRKKQTEQLAVYKEAEKHEKVNKERGEKAKKRSFLLSDETDVLRAQVEDIGKRIREATEKAEEAWALVESSSKIVGQLEGKRIEQRTKEESVQSLRLNLVEMSESDGELSGMLEDYEARVQSYENDHATSIRKYNEMKASIQTAQDKVVAKERECGTFEAQKQRYDDQVASREGLIRETARTHNVRGYDLDVTDDQAQAFIERIAKMARDQNTTFERVRRETAEELRGAQNVLTQINEQKSGLNSRKESARQNVATNDRKLGSLQSQLDKISIDEGGKTALESHLQDTESRLQTNKAGFEGKYWEKTIGDADAELRAQEELKDKLDAELVEGTRQAGDSARLDFVQKELKDRQRSLETMQGAHGEKISSVIGADWSPASIEAQFQRAVDDKNTKVADAERQRDGVARELEQLDFRLNTVRSDLKAKNSSLNRAAQTIKDVVDCAPEDYTQELVSLEHVYNTAKKDADSFDVIRKYFELCLKTATESHACSTCMRGFGSDKDKDRAIKNIQTKLGQFEASDQEQLEDVTKSLKAARDVGIDFDTWERLKEKEIPALETEERKLSDKRTTLNDKLEQLDGSVDICRESKRDTESMSRTVQNISRYQTEITSFGFQIKDLIAKQKTAGLSRGLETMQDEIKKVNDDTKAVRARLAKATNDRDRQRANINALELEVRDIKSKLSNAEYQLKEKTSLETQVKEVKDASSQQREAIRKVDQDLQGLGPQLAQAQEKYDDVAKRGAERDRELQSQTSKLNTNLNQLKMADQEIQAYLDRSGPEQLKRGKREIENLKAEMTRLEEEQQLQLREVKRIENSLRNHADTKRSISDNQRYRRDRRALIEVEAKIKELEATGAEAEKARCEKKGGDFQNKRTMLLGEQASMIGQIKSMDDQLETLLADYNTEYKSAARDYKKAHINVETTKACIEDLTRYGGALDKAIMKFHQMKMEEINRIIDELWRKTYQGTDVDTILIKSENEASGNARKIYNYRVCMIKSDAEMDMRGRCSAGQKVLASIIIRLALAECFGVNCGLIALDEPTTNLDRDNIQSLATSLSEIIKVRRQQKNFQLIVITHDEDFLRFMGCSDFADNYWRVSRNESQKSIIEKQNIAEVL